MSVLSSFDYIELENTYGTNNYKPLDLVLEKGQGIWVWDVEGNKYLDCLSSFSALNQGHCHPKILETFIEQAKKLTLTSRAFRNSQLSLFCKEICELTGFHKVLPMNTGAEAVETAIKTARKWGYEKKGIEKHKAEIIVCSENFHGRTTTVISFSSDENSKAPFGPLTPGFVTIPFGDAEALDKAINPNTCAFLVEPIQGEAGIKVPPDGYLKKIHEICQKNNVLLILDEIQTGFGRTGKLFAFQHENIKPDILTIGKALSGGFYPVSAVLAQEGILELFRPGEHGSTFGGNSLACAVARTAIKVLTDEGLVENSAKLGKYFLEKLKTINSPYIKEIRGRGLFLAVELNTPARPFCEKLKNVGILVKETHDTIIRIAPPLVIKQEEIDFVFDKIKQVMEA
jgi:ornithine--oxo-acid transaminase